MNLATVSKTQNIARLQGKMFIYHLKTKPGDDFTKCNKVLNPRSISYTELHDAQGIARLCYDCRKEQ